MKLKDRLAAMVEQYSITKDNPTVLRELMKLSAILDVLIDYNEDVETKLEELEKEIDNLDPGKVAELVQSIQESVNALETQVAGKQDKLTFDSTPTEGSSNPVTSDGIKKAIDAIPGGTTVVLDDTVTEASQNGVKSSGIYSAIQEAKDELNTGIEEARMNADNAFTDADNALTAANEAKAGLENKQDKLTFDSTPTEGSSNPVTSDGIKKAIEAIPGGGTVTLDDTVTETSQNGVKSSGIYSAIQTAQQASATALANTNKVVSAHTGEIEALQEFQQTQETTNQTHNDQIAANIQSINGLSGDIAALEADKMNKMTVDTNPTENSQNLVTSGGVFADLSALSIGKQNKLTAGGVQVSSAVAAELTEAPTSANQLVSSLAIWNAIQTAVAGAGGGIKNINVTAKKLTFSDIPEITGPCTILPDNFIPLVIHFTGTLTDTDFTGASKTVNVAFEEHVITPQSSGFVGTYPMFGYTGDTATNTAWLYLATLKTSPKIVTHNDIRYLEYRDDRMSVWKIAPQIQGNVNQLESGDYNFYVTYAGFEQSGDYDKNIKFDKDLYVIGLEIS